MILDGLSDEEILGLTIIGEARGEPIQGQVAVGATCRNRMHDDPGHYRNYKDVCLEPKQFSCWNTDDTNQPYLIELAERLVTGHQLTDPYLRQCMLVAHGIVNWDIIDNTKGSRYYMTTKLFVEARPRWAKNPLNVMEFGNQTFFNI